MRRNQKKSIPLTSGNFRPSKTDLPFYTCTLHLRYHTGYQTHLPPLAKIQCNESIVCSHADTASTHAQQHARQLFHSTEAQALHVSKTQQTQPNLMATKHHFAPSNHDQKHPSSGQSCRDKTQAPLWHRTVWMWHHRLPEPSIHVWTTYMMRSSYKKLAGKVQVIFLLGRLPVWQSNLHILAWNRGRYVFLQFGNELRTSKNFWGHFQHVGLKFLIALPTLGARRGDSNKQVASQGQLHCPKFLSYIPTQTSFQNVLVVGYMFGKYMLKHMWNISELQESELLSRSKQRQSGWNVDSGTPMHAQEHMLPPNSNNGREKLQTISCRRDCLQN